MSGHSKWSNIKHRKGAMDAKRGKLFSKLSRLISIAAKEKGADPDANPRLRMAIDKAREANMPKDNIERAVKKGAGQLEDAAIEEVTYEAYGPAGIALIITTITDNKNRALSEIKAVLTRHGAKMAEAGSVKYMFKREGENWVPTFEMAVDEKSQSQLEKLFDALDDLDDVQEIYSNLK